MSNDNQSGPEKYLRMKFGQVFKEPDVDIIVEAIQHPDYRPAIKALLGMANSQDTENASLKEQLHHAKMCLTAVTLQALSTDDGENQHFYFGSVNANLNDMREMPDMITEAVIENGVLTVTLKPKDPKGGQNVH